MKNKIKNKEEFKKYNILCEDLEQVQECFDILEELGFNVGELFEPSYSIVSFCDELTNFGCYNQIDRYYKSISFYHFKQQVKLLLKQEIKPKEDFKVAEDGRIIKINNWKADKIVYTLNPTPMNIGAYSKEIIEHGINLGILFLTEEARDKAVFKLQIETKLKNIAEILNNGKKNEWEKLNQKKYHIVFNYEENTLQCYCNYYAKCQGIIYCLSNKFLDEAVKEIGKEDLKKYFKED